MHFLIVVYHFAERWLGSLSQVFLVFLGIFISLSIIVGLWDRRIRPIGACIGVIIGFSLVFSKNIFSFFSQFEIPARVALWSLLFGCVLGLITCWSVRVAILRQRYAFLWCGMSMGLIISSVFPWAIGYLSKDTFAHSYVLIGAGCIGFLALILLCVSLILTKLERRYEQLTQRKKIKVNDARPPFSRPEGSAHQCRYSQIKYFFALALNELQSIKKQEVGNRSIRGTRIGAPVIICFACLAVLSVGFATPQAMIGDEVTHYYMLVNQSHDITKPNFFADIPQATGKIERRRYPHAFLWHYFGAIVYRLSGHSFFGVQLYQAFFLFQLLTVAYLLAKSRGG